MNAGTPRVRIVADDRENAGGVIAELRRLEGVEVEVRRLRTGDFVVAGRFVVERIRWALEEPPAPSEEAV